MIAKIRHYINRFLYQKKRAMLTPLSGGYAAHGQDIFIAEKLGGRKNGFFIDIGANDGVTFSNSLYFEKELGWNGIAVEPVASAYATLKEKRSCHLVQGCVSITDGKKKFVELVGQNMFSTLEEHNTGLTERRLQKRAKRANTELKTTEVDCFTVMTLAKKFGVKSVDFLSLDTEGGELDILKTIDFQAMPVSALSVENNYYSDSLKNYLEKKDFVYMGTFSVDEIYIHQSELQQQMN